MIFDVNECIAITVCDLMIWKGSKCLNFDRLNERYGEVRQITVCLDGDVKTRGLARHVRPVHKLVVPDQCPNAVLTVGEDAQIMRIDSRDKKPEKLLIVRNDGLKVPLNSQTIKGVIFFGPYSELVMSGSDCGNFFIWDRNTEAIVQFQWLPGDHAGVVNCLEGHPRFPILATSALNHKIWSPNKVDGRPSHDELKKCIQRNLRKADHTYFSDLNHSLMEYFMRHFSRRANRRNAAARQPNASDSSSEEDFNFNADLSGGDDNDDDDGNDNDNIFDRGGQCNTS